VPDGLRDITRTAFFFFYQRISILFNMMGDKIAPPEEKWKGRTAE